MNQPPFRYLEARGVSSDWRGTRLDFTMMEAGAKVGRFARVAKCPQCGRMGSVSRPRKRNGAYLAGQTIHRAVYDSLGSEIRYWGEWDTCFLPPPSNRARP